MNVMVPTGPPLSSLLTRHCISEYRRTTDELAAETEVPGFLDSLVLKIAEIDEDDPDAAFSYELTIPQITTFSFLLGFEVQVENCAYFLEPTGRAQPSYPDDKAKAISVFDKLASRAISANRRTRRITENELILPILRILATSNGAWMRTSELIARLTELFRPTVTDTALVGDRSEANFAQQVRNMISHKDRPSSFIRQGLAEFRKEERGLRITDLGRKLVGALRSQ